MSDFIDHNSPDRYSIKSMFLMDTGLHYIGVQNVFILAHWVCMCHFRVQFIDGGFSGKSA